MRNEGQITFDQENKKLVVDAEPHVMQRVRKIFDNSDTFWEKGKYTHKPIRFSFSLSACRDLVWILDRYNLEVEEKLLNQIKDRSNEYDDILKKVSTADKDATYKISSDSLPLFLPLRTHQIQFNNMFNQMKRMLLADKMGLGKTPSAISILCDPDHRPALIVVPTHLCTQWEREVNKFLPGATTHVIRGFKNYPLPKVDVIITSYNRLAPWQDILLDPVNKFKTLIMDEVHELRHTGTGKRTLCYQISESVSYCLGLSGTPIYNQGNEIYSVLDVIKPECLGVLDDFEKEWCSWGKVYEPAVLNHFLKQQGLMLRRTAEEVGLNFGEASKHIYTIDSDLEKLKEIEDIAKLLAISVLSGNVGEDSESAREFDWKLRHATGVAKARPVAEFVKMLVEQGEKVVLAGWHRDVYEVWLKELKDLKPVMYTGSESAKEKDQAVKDFVEGDSKIFIISLRSGSGLDGLQKACNTVVFGELDWSPHVMDQVVARVDRDGQTQHVQAFYLTIADGADPFMVQVLSGKRSQHDGLIEGKRSEVEIIKTYNSDRIKDMAKAYLTSIGEEIPESILETGLLGKVVSLVRTLKLPTNTEEEMQEALHNALQKDFPNVLREYKISKRSRLDFMIQEGNERVAIECKIDSTKRTEVYRQVRRYAEEASITSLVLAAPWHGITSFKVDNVPVLVVDTNINAI